MSETALDSPPLICRRCGEAFAGSSSPLASCPYCGASIRPLWRAVGRHNGFSAVLGLLALCTLCVAIVMPFISMSKLGEVRVFSLVGAVKELFDRGNWFIGSILFIFSLVFPFAKLFALLAATSAMTKLTPAGRKRLHHLAMLTGKYSLLDILVVAIMIVLVKFNGVAEVKALPGTILFGVAVLLSIASGALVDLPEESSDFD